MSGPSTILTPHVASIEHDSIAKGGYRIRIVGQPPKGTRLLLSVNDGEQTLDVTGRPAQDLLNAANLPGFLALIGSQKAWGTSAVCRLIVRRGAAVLSMCKGVKFACPVKPLVCKPGLGGPSLGLSDEQLSKLTYAGDNDGGAFGRFLRIPAIDNCYYFQNGHGPTFETDDTMRGLVCTTYIGAVWQLKAVANGPMTKRGSDIAAMRGDPFFCADVGMNSAKLSDVKKYLSEHPSETFLVGSSGHIVLAVRGVIHDFTTAPRRGYNKRPVSSWHPASKVWTIGKPLRQF